MNPKKYPLYATTRLPRSYLIGIEESYAEVFERFNDFKGVVQEIEGQFLPENERDLYFFPVKKTRVLNKKVKEFIQNAVDYAKAHRDKKLPSNWTSGIPVKVYASRVDKAITLLERRLKQKYPNYDKDYVYGDYQTGSLLNYWVLFLKEFERLFALL